MIKIQVDAAHAVSALVERPEGAFACLVLAHGAGAGMNHSFMANVAQGLAERGVATLRFQFPFMEAASRRPDRPALAHATVRAAVGKAAILDLPLFAGGKSFGARMTSQTQAEAPLPAVRGLIFLGFPLHPAGKPSDERAQHLSSIHVPMLFLQGTRDALADVGLLGPVAQAAGARLHLLDQANHSFHAPVRSGLTDAGVMAQALDVAAGWMRDVAATIS